MNWLIRVKAHRHTHTSWYIERQIRHAKHCQSTAINNDRNTYCFIGFSSRVVVIGQL